MKTVFVDVQGYKLEDFDFVLKEIAISVPQQDQLQVFQILPPFPIYNLSSNDRKQVNWIEKNRRLYWNDGYIPYNRHHMYLKPLLSNTIIYCKGFEKVNWIKAMFNTNFVYNLEDKQCPKLLNLHEKYNSSTDVYSCIYHPTTCALKNVICLKKWSLENKII